MPPAWLILNTEAQKMSTLKITGYFYEKFVFYAFL